MKIVMVRHGRPAEPRRGGWLDGEGGRLWLAAYDACGLAPGTVPPARTVRVAQGCRAAVASDLPRAVESARALGLEGEIMVDPLFREVGLSMNGRHGFRLPAGLLLVLGRVRWVLGMAGNGETLRAALARAALAASRLNDLAHEHGSVLLVGHGLMNALIARALIADGWTGPGLPCLKHWDAGVYRRS